MNTWVLYQLERITLIRTYNKVKFIIKADLIYFLNELQPTKLNFTTKIVCPELCLRVGFRYGST